MKAGVAHRSGFDKGSFGRDPSQRIGGYCHRLRISAGFMPARYLYVRIADANVFAVGGAVVAVSSEPVDSDVVANREIFYHIVEFFYG